MIGQLIKWSCVFVDVSNFWRDTAWCPCLSQSNKNKCIFNAPTPLMGGGGGGGGGAQIKVYLFKRCIYKKIERLHLSFFFSFLNCGLVQLLWINFTAPLLWSSLVVSCDTEEEYMRCNMSDGKRFAWIGFGFRWDAYGHWRWADICGRGCTGTQVSWHVLGRAIRVVWCTHCYKLFLGLAVGLRTASMTFFVHLSF